MRTCIGTFHFLTFYFSTFNFQLSNFINFQLKKKNYNMEYTIKITIQAASSNEANEITKSLLTIYKHLSTEDLKIISGHIEKDPAVVQKVRNIADNPFVRKLFGKKL